MQKVLIAEDDLMVADMLSDILVDAGYEVCGIARTVQEGVELGQRTHPDLAVLDLRLANGGLGTHIAARFAGLARPAILYATGNSGQIDLTGVDGEAWLGKPYRADELVRALQLVVELKNTGKTSQPIPNGFHILNGGRPAATARPPYGAGEAHEIKRLRRQQAALAAFGSFALSERDLGAVLTEAARVCAEGLEVPFCKVCRYRPEENDLLVDAGVGWHEGVVGHVVSRADTSSPQGRAFITGEPVICNNLHTDEGFVLPSFYAEHGIISTVDVVIRKKDGQPYGVLEIDNPKQHDYDSHDIDFLTGFANVLAEAVETAKRNVALQVAFDEMHDMVADRDRLLEAKSELLAEKSRLLDEKSVLAEELQHRVRNNLQLVYGMISQQARASTDPVGKEDMSGIARRVMTLAQVYDHLLGTGLSRTIDFGSYLTSLCANIESLRPEPRSGVVLTCVSVPLILDLDSVTSLGLVVSELLSNSYAHAFPDGKGAIGVTLSRDPATKAATILFTDDGIGFTEPANTTRHGISLVKRLIMQVDGTAELTADHGTRWTLTFPMPAGAGD